MGLLPPEMPATQKSVSVTQSPPIAGSHPAFSGGGVGAQRAFLPLWARRSDWVTRQPTAVPDTVHLLLVLFTLILKVDRGRQKPGTCDRDTLPPKRVTRPEAAGRQHLGTCRLSSPFPVCNSLSGPKCVSLRNPVTVGRGAIFKCPCGERAPCQLQIHI